MNKEMGACIGKSKPYIPYLGFPLSSRKSPSPPHASLSCKSLYSQLSSSTGHSFSPKTQLGTTSLFSNSTGHSFSPATQLVTTSLSSQQLLTVSLRQLNWSRLPSQASNCSRLLSPASLSLQAALFPHLSRLSRQN